MELDAALRLLVALAIGLIVGFERGSRTAPRLHLPQRADGIEDLDQGAAVRAAGLRTFALMGLLGGVLWLVADGLGDVLAAALVLVAGLLVVGSIALAGYLAVLRESRDAGSTTEVALVLTFCLGALAAAGWMLEAVGASVVTALLLGYKRELHAALERLERREVQASLQMLLIALVALPLLPDERLGPWESLNPRTIGLLVMLIALVGFVGYFAVRLVGTRAGTLFTAFLGGLTSSTAVTVTFARLARRRPAHAALFGAAIALGCGTMAPRLLIEVAAVNAALVSRLVWPLLPLAVIPLVAAFWIARRHADPSAPAELVIDNPLELRQALLLGIVLALFFVLVRGAEVWFGESGLYALAAISGLADVDALALTLAARTREGLAPEVAARAILLAALVNTCVKALLAALLGGGSAARWASSILLAALLPAGLLMLLLD